MVPSHFEYTRPKTLDEAIAILAENPDDAKILAGGQSLVSMLKLRLANPRLLVDLNRVPGLDYIRENGNTIEIGAMVRYSEVQSSQLIQSKCSLLPKAAAVVGDVQIRNRGTIGGSVAHADPAGDVPAAVLALRAEIKVHGPNGERWVNADDFFLGMYAIAMEADEILTAIRVPVLTAHKTAYLKSARRPSDFAIVGIAAMVKTDKDGVCEDISLAVTGVIDKPYRPVEVENRLKGTKLDEKAIAAAAPAITEGLDVNGNMHASPEFRAHLAQVYLARTIQAAN